MRGELNFMRGQNKVLKEIYDTERKQIEQLFQQRERQQLLLEKLLVKERPAHQAGTVQRPVHAVQPLRRVQRRTEATPPSTARALRESPVGTPVEEEDTQACAGCGVKASAPWGFFAAGKRWHAKCFTCADCGKQLGHKVPYCVEGTRAYHPACWRRSCLPVCNPAGDPSADAVAEAVAAVVNEARDGRSPAENAAGLHVDAIAFEVASKHLRGLVRDALGCLEKQGRVCAASGKDCFAAAPAQAVSGEHERSAAAVLRTIVTLEKKMIEKKELDRRGHSLSKVHLELKGKLTVEQIRGGLNLLLAEEKIFFFEHGAGARPDTFKAYEKYLKYC